MKSEGSVALVTGGASGLGAGVARMLIEHGASVAVFDLASSRGAELCEELGERAFFMPVDVTDTVAVQSGVGAVIDRFGRLDLLVSAAGIIPAARMIGRNDEIFPLETFVKALDVNLVGAFDVIRNSVAR